MITRMMCITCFAMLMVGCTRSSDFAKLKTYLEQTSQNQIEAGVLFWHMKPVYEPLDKGISFLLSMTESANRKDAIAAYLALSELCAQVRRQPTPQGQALVEKINPKELFLRYDKLDKVKIEGNWAAWLSMAHRTMKQSLEPLSAGDVLKAAPEK